MILTKPEMETIIIYNQEDKTADCSTFDPKLIRKLDTLAQKHEAITSVAQGDGWKQYKFPKSYIKINPPRELSEKTRKELSERMKALRKE